MNPLWLLLIVPATSIFILIIASLLWAADDSDARMIALLKDQYIEMETLAEISDEWETMATRHEAERREIEG
jgi:hypothetical protein